MLLRDVLSIDKNTKAISKSLRFARSIMGLDVGENVRELCTFAREAEPGLYQKAFEKIISTSVEVSDFSKRLYQFSRIVMTLQEFGFIGWNCAFANEVSASIRRVVTNTTNTQILVRLIPERVILFQKCFFFSEIQKPPKMNNSRNFW